MGIWKRFSLVSFVIALIVTAGGYLAWKLYHAKFTAQARLLVAAQAPNVLFQTVETEAKEDYKRYQNTQQALVKSQLALNAALQDTEVRKYRMIREQVDPVRWLQDNLKVEFIAGSELMEISLTGDYPDEVAGIVNAVKKAYIDEVVNRDIKMRTARYNQLKKLKAQYAEMLRERRENLRKLVDTAGGDRAATDEASRIRRVATDELVVQRVRLQVERATVESRRAHRRKAVGPATDSLRKETEEIEETLAGLLAQEKVIDTELKQIGGAIQNVANPTLDLEALKTDIALMESTYRKVAAEVEALSVELGAPPRVRTIEDAVPPLTRVALTNWGF